MKTFITALAITSLLVVGAMAYAHGPGAGGRMMGQGYGGHMMSWGGQGNGPDQAFFAETVDLRRELHDKKFEYREASRNPETKIQDLANIEKDIRDLQGQIREKNPGAGSGGKGFGNCW